MTCLAVAAVCQGHRIRSVKRDRWDESDARLGSTLK